MERVIKLSGNELVLCLARNELQHFVLVRFIFLVIVKQNNVKISWKYRKTNVGYDISFQGECVGPLP